MPVLSRNSRKLKRIALTAVLAASFMGCRLQPKPPVETCAPLCADQLQKISYPDVCENDIGNNNDDLLTGPPLTLSTFEQMPSWDLTLEEAVNMALTNNKILQRLGGVVVSSPQATATTYEQAIVETNPNASVEAALSAFDAQVATSLFFNHNERKFNNTFQQLFSASRQDTANFQTEISKQTVSGTRFAARNITDYTNNHLQPGVPSSFRFNSVYNTVNQFEVRHPLMRGNGAMVNRIAGPNAVSGQYNGVLIARIRSDQSLADFEAAVRDLVRDVELNYWELYFAYRDLDTKMAARESSRGIWENRQIRYEKGLGRPDEEAQARQQYYSFEFQVQNALSGTTTGQLGVLGSERNLRRLLGLSVNDGRMIRPASEPAVAPIMFDWNASQEQAMATRVELRRQKWSIRQRELELCAAKQLNQWRLDLVGLYGFRGFGDNLFGSRSRPEGSAVADLFTGKLDDWQLGLDMQGPVGNRQAFLAVRNAELRLSRERAVYREQQRQVLHDLAAAYAEVDRAMANIRTSYNSYIAAQEELGPKRLRVEEGKDQVFFLLDAQQRFSTSESAFYRSIVDYNRALLSFTYASGGLLARYNVTLDEGGWDPSLQSIANGKADRFRNNGWGVDDRDLNPISAGPFNQQMPGGATGVRTIEAPSDDPQNPDELDESNGSGDPIGQAN